MRLFYHKEPLTEAQKKEIYESVQKGYGIEHPERISGFRAAFYPCTPDIYVSDALEKILLENPSFASVLMDKHGKMMEHEFGDISEQVKDNNLESIYFNGGNNIHGRYKTIHGMLNYGFFQNLVLMYFDDENIDEFLQLDKSVQRS